jgi:hypothetical protein
MIADSARAQNAILGAGRKRKSRRTRKVKRGGGKYGGVTASFTGTGSRGIADYAGYTTRDEVGVAREGNFNNKGIQPGSGFASFITTDK